MDEIFISYKREERDAAQILARALESKGYTVWWDLNLRAGEHFDARIEEVLERAKCVIVLWSALSIRSQYVIDEASYALKYHKIIPVLLDDAQVPFRFQGLHMIRFKNWDGTAHSSEFAQLLRDIGPMIQPPSDANTVVDESLPLHTNWRAELVHREGWNLALQIFLDQQSHLLEYTRSLTDESISLNHRRVLSKFSLPLSNDARSSHKFRIRNGATRCQGKIRVRVRHMTIIEFQLLIDEQILYSYSEEFGR